MVGSSSDITDRKMAEHYAQQFSEELKRSNQDLEQFAYIASHDLQEPLRKVASCCQVLSEDYGDKLDEKGHEWINYAVDGAKRMGVLIADLLAYSRIGTQKNAPEQLNSQEIYEEAIDSLAEAIKDANAEIICRPLPNVMANQTQLLHLLQNLIGNAIKYRGDDPLVIEVGAEPLRIERPDRDAQEMWQFYVKDNGIGIDPAYYEKIFVIFQRLHTREKYEGTGIGLAFCKKIVERMGGSIWVESKPGQGSTFFFTVPAVEKNVRGISQTSKTDEQLEGSNV
jgi:light-regulated signal transduction histidine kinase (bacteriophytochrome)